MPIYVYRCDDCGRDHEALQKLSDPVLRLCPHCGHEALAKQVSAAAFQLKGNGWYATDFRGSGKPAEACKPAEVGAAAAQCASCPAAAASSD
ncbi:MAG: zinc ribbon domain-containing protein [Burkholderiaceae bacterium]|nr:zinc ribbon domain-containing protein [Burkholderiaceae bacterium]